MNTNLFVQDAGNEVLGELSGKPDLIIGNYSDGNLVATLLSQHLDVTQVCQLTLSRQRRDFTFYLVLTSLVALSCTSGPSQLVKMVIKVCFMLSIIFLQCIIAHALEKTKYPDSDIYWKKFEEKYHFSCQFTADLIAMNSADFIITSTYQEIAGRCKVTAS